MVEVMRTWLRSGEYALLDNIALLPLCRSPLSTEPMVIESEEGFAYFLIDNFKRGWILKKFSPGREPDRAYADAIQELIPPIPGFESGFARKVLKFSSVSSPAFCNGEFQAWIDGTVLMPQVVSPTWSEFSDSIRNGSVAPPTVERLLLCCKLSEMVDRLESVGVAHRDLSSRNMMIDPLTLELHFIDWDSLYHGTLTMQANATCGTNGYVAPFVTLNGHELVHLTWHEKADRFALAVLNSELMVAKAGSVRVEDGGLLRQSDIDKGSGATLVEVRNDLIQTFPDAVHFLDAALSASSFLGCPSPTDWIEFTKKVLSDRVELNGVASL